MDYNNVNHNRQHDLQQTNNTSESLQQNSRKYLIEDYFSSIINRFKKNNTTTSGNKCDINNNNNNKNENDVNRHNQQENNISGNMSGNISGNISENLIIENNNNIMNNIINDVDINKNTTTNNDAIVNKNTTTEIKQFFQQRIISSKNITNESWGSNIKYKHKNNSRLYFQNVNSLRYNDIGIKKWATCCEYMKESQCDIFGLAESCVDWKESNIKTKFQNQSNTIFNNNCSLTFSNNRFPLTSTYLPGGVIQAATGHWAGKVQNIILDESNMGRWCGQTFRLKNNKSLSVITAYRPCKNTNNRTSTRNTYQQQYIMLRDKGHSNPNPRAHFINDLIQLVNKLENEMHSVIVLIDANEGINEDEGSLTRIFDETTLVDIFTTTSSEECNITSYTRGTKRIDYILTSYNLIPYITQTGYLPFYEDDMDSDHRGCFIDLDNKMLDNIIENQRPPRRNIGSNSSTHEIIAYIRYVNEQFKIHNIYQRSKNFFDIEKNHDSKGSKKWEHESNLINLDTQITEIILKSEKQFCKRYHETEWSLEVHHTNLEMKYWMCKYKASINHKSVTKKLESLLDQMPTLTKNRIISIHDNNPKIQWRKLLKYKKELLKHSKELRQKGLAELLVIRAKENEKVKVNIIKRVIKSENMKHNWEALARIFKNDIKSGINFLEVPNLDKNGDKTDNPENAQSWKIISDPIEMNEKLIQRNIKHFGQAHGNDFTINPLLELFQYEGCGNFVDMLIEGRFEDILENIDPPRGIKTLLSKINSTKQLKGIDDNINFEDWISALRSWSERTTTSPSGRHLGHLKVCLVPITVNIENIKENKAITGMDPKTCNDELKRMQLQILEVYYHVSLTCLHQGTSLPRWQEVTTAMIKKDPNVSKINKLRVIHLYEADYNLILKILWSKRLVWNAHDNDKINSGQAGSRPGCNAIDIVILKEMKYLYSRLTKTNLATMDNDAKSCYDRIICNLAMIISRLYGMSPNACRLHGTTLKKMRFRLRTAIGDSTNKYSHTNESPIHGTGQGSCASPSIWLLISSILMDCLMDLAGGMKMQDVLEGKSLQEWINGFVDDTSLFCNVEGNNINKIKQQLQQDMIVWQELLEASGGKLELSKCFYYILSWKFNEEGDAYPMSIEEQLIHTVPISISTNINEITIKQKQPNEAHKTLGCMKSINGDESAEVLYLKNKAIKYTQQIRNARLSKIQARLAYNCIFIPSLRYGLPSFSLTSSEIDSIQKTAVEQFLRAMGYEKSFPRDLVYAHQDFGGLQLPHLFSEMSSMKLEALVSHIRAESALGKALIININTIQIISGSIHPLLEYNTNLNYIDDNWIMHLRSFIFSINATIKIDNIWRPQFQRENDIFLMDIFRTKTNMTTRQLTLVNYWRVYFQVMMLSDICEPDDSNKVQYVFTKENMSLSNKMQQSLLNWPYQEKPGKKGFQLWISCLRQCFNFNKRDRSINWKLGKWQQHHQGYNKWYYYYDSVSSQIYHSVDTGYNCYRPITSRSHSSTFNNKCIIFHASDIPQSSTPAHSLEKQEINTCFYSSKHNISRQTTYEEQMINIPLSWKEYIRTLPEWQKSFMKHSYITNKELAYASLSTSKDIFIVNDGGTTITNQGTFGTVLSNTDDTFYNANGKCYNNHYYSSSYRAESQAILSGLLSITHLLKYLNITISTNQHLRIYCDNKKLLRNLSQYSKYNMTVNDRTKPDYDIIIEILTLLKSLQRVYSSISLHHVSSKKAENSKGSVAHEVSMHILAHKLAKEARSMRDVTYRMMPHNNVHLIINDHNINANMGKIAKKCYHSINARKFLQEKYDWNNKTIEDIWWNTHAKSLQRLSYHDRIKIQKFIHNHSNTNHRENKYYEYKSAICSTCQHTEETEDHILKCKTYERKKIRQSWFKKLLELEKNIIPIQIRKAICLGIRNWLEGPLHNVDQILDTFPDHIQQAFRNQSIIGWDHFVRGRLSLSWGVILNEKLSAKNFDAEAWGSTIIDINFEHILLLWEHRCKIEHGESLEDQESHKKQKLLREIKHIQASRFMCNNNDAKILYRDFEELRNLNCRQLEDWLVGAKILYKIGKKTIINIPHYFQVKKNHEIPIDPG